MSAINQLSRDVAAALGTRGLCLVTVESCTGGLIAAQLTSLPGSSEWFEGAFVTYRLRAKRQLVGVPAETLERHGAVSEPTARAMAEGALTVSDADLSVAVTGVAGPGGGDLLAPVGTVWFAWAAATTDGPRCLHAARHRLTGSRDEVRRAAVAHALEGVLAVVADLA